MQSLCPSFNLLTRGAEELATGLEVLLESNHIGDAGALELAKAVAANHALTSLSFESVMTASQSLLSRFRG